MEKITQAKIKYYDGSLYLETNGNPVLVDISYKGKISAESNMPDGFIVLEKPNRIIIMRFNQNQMPEHILDYVGTFRIQNATVYDSLNSIVPAEIEALNHQWKNMSKDGNTWGDSTSVWESHYEYEIVELSEDRRHNPNLRKVMRKESVIINNNLHTDSMGKFYLPDGTPYEGDINYDSRGTFRTGVSKDSSSVPLNYNAKKIKIRRRNG